MRYLMMSAAALSVFTLAACDNNNDNDTTAANTQAPAGAVMQQSDSRTAPAPVMPSEPQVSMSEPQASDMNNTAPAQGTATAPAPQDTQTMSGVSPSTIQPEQETFGQESAEGTTEQGESTEADTTMQTADCSFDDLVGRKYEPGILNADSSRPVRVLYPDSAATMDYNPERINVLLERDTEIITEIRCG